MSRLSWHRHGGWIAFAAGLPVPLAFAPFDFYWLLPLLLAVLFRVWDDVTPRQAAWRGWLFGLGAFLTGTHWLYFSLHVFGKAPLALALVLMAGLMALMAAYTALLGYTAVRAVPRGGPLRWMVMLPAGWVLAEWLRGWLLSGFPWLSLGYATTEAPLAGWMPIGGVFAASGAVVLTAGAVRWLTAGGARARLAASAIVAAVWVGGALLHRVGWTVAADRELQISIVQGAVPQDRKWLPEELVPTMRLYRDLTWAHWDSDLVIWPEAAIPALLRSLGGYFDELHGAARSTDTALVAGVIETDPDTGQYYNSVLALAETRAIYRKRHLVPFGEYFPVPAFVREWLRLRNLPYSDYTPGGDDQAPLRAAGEKIAASICYEDVFGNEQRAMLPEATLLVNVSNDAWFGRSIAPDQHLQIARVRAIESRRFMLRATNTGISAIVDTRGRIVGTVPQFESRVLTGRVRGYTGTTPYVVVGDRGIVVLAGLLGLFALVAARR